MNKICSGRRHLKNTVIIDEVLCRNERIFLSDVDRCQIAMHLHALIGRDHHVMRGQIGAQSTGPDQNRLQMALHRQVTAGQNPVHDGFRLFGLAGPGHDHIVDRQLTNGATTAHGGDKSCLGQTDHNRPFPSHTLELARRTR